MSAIVKRWVIVALSSCTIAATALAQFNVVTSVPTLTYTMADGSDILDATATIEIRNKLPAMEANVAAIAISLIQQSYKTYFTPLIQMGLDLGTAVRYSNSAEAAAIAKQMNDKWSAFQSSNVQHAIDLGLGNGAQPAIRTVFDDYVKKVGQAVQNAQGTATYIASYIKNNEAGLKLLNAAFTFQGSKYRPGMECNNLFTDSLLSLGFATPSYPFCSGCTPTRAWFQYGLGPAFSQILGGADGIALRQLADGNIANTLSIPGGTLPIGAVIIADGHVALYDGVEIAGTTPEIITYDANNTQGWTVSTITGSAKPDQSASGNDLGIIQLVFAGHQVGEHVTRLQWVDSTKVKVFKFIGNPLSPEPHVSITHAVNLQCNKNVQLATALKAEACTSDQTAAACKNAIVRLAQVIQLCSNASHD